MRPRCRWEGQGERERVPTDKGVGCGPYQRRRQRLHAGRGGSGRQPDSGLRQEHVARHITERKRASSCCNDGGNVDGSHIISHLVSNGKVTHIISTLSSLRWERCSIPRRRPRPFGGRGGRDALPLRLLPRSPYDLVVARSSAAVCPHFLPHWSTRATCGLFLPSVPGLFFL